MCRRSNHCFGGSNFFRRGRGAEKRAIEETSFRCDGDPKDANGRAADDHPHRRHDPD